MTDVTTNIPAYGTPIIDARGNINEVWWRFFTTLLARTGGLEGFDIDVLVSQVKSVDALQASSVGVERAFPDGLPADVSVARQGIQEAPGPVQVQRQPLDLMALLTAPTHGQQHDPGLHALATTTADGFMSAADKVKLNNLSVPAVVPATLIADAVTTNTTADGVILSIAVPAGALLAGSTLSLRMFGLVSSAAIAGTLSFWVKIGATKVLSQSFTLPVLGVTNAGVFYTANATVRTAGAAGTIQLSSLMTSGSNALNGGPVVGTAAGSIDTTAANTFTIGWNWSVANAGNTATAKNATIILEKQ